MEYFVCSLLSLNLAGEWRTYVQVQLDVGAIGHVPEDQRMQWETELSQPRSTGKWHLGAHGR